ncbi:GntR family transcriptional regulator [Brevibacterium casei]|uniref:GntR family transcriptional regulator n=1 Tax=Brevibacterium casei TaxID=33889 RepID=UPI0036F5468E
MAQSTSASSARIAQALRTRILSGELKPGARIRQEEIAAEFGVSRIPIRESLRLLESAGLITIVASSGAWVASMNMPELQESYLIRERLEPLLLGMAVPLHTDDSIARLRELVDLVNNAQSVDEFLDLDRRFHLATFEGPTADSLRSMVDRLWNSTQHYRRAFMQLVWEKHPRETFMEHELIVDAISNRDVRAAEDLMSLHLRRTRLALEHHPEIFTVQ